MNVHLIRTPGYAYDDMVEICDFLNSFEGPLQFSASAFDFSTHESFEDLKISDANNSSMQGLTWDRLFELCHYYRNLFNVAEEDFVVLLTERRNLRNWFSFFDLENNAFIHTADWHFYTNTNPLYPIAYEVVENILHTLMRIEHVLPNKYVHEVPRGCVNDLCQDKRQIVLKLQTANICPDCGRKIRSENIDRKIIDQTLSIFEGIRNEFLFRQRFIEEINPYPVVVGRDNRILLPSLGNLEIRLNPLFKTLYLFYLKHTEGVRLNELIDFKTELLSIYRRLTTADDDQTIESRINDIIDPFSGSFSQKKSKINREISRLLGEPLDAFYRIEGERGEPFKISIPPHLIDIRY